MKTDLHVHTYYSDGKFSPKEIAALAKKEGVELLSMTDHDSMEGIKEKRTETERAGMKFVAGWEVSSYNEIGKVHILGYGCKTEGAYERFLRDRIEGSLVRAEDSIEKANAYFHLALTIDDARREQSKPEAPLHTMHVVRAYTRVLNCGKNALQMRLGEIYNNFFAKGKPAYSELCRPKPADAVRVIHEAGGIAVLAHPGRIPACAERLTLFHELCAQGLDGMECVYSTHTQEETAYFTEYAKAHGLLVTGGSDFHAENGRRVIGKPAFEPDERLLVALGIN